MVEEVGNLQKALNKIAKNIELKEAINRLPEHLRIRMYYNTLRIKAKPLSNEIKEKVKEYQNKIREFGYINYNKAVKKREYRNKFVRLDKIRTNALEIEKSGNREEANRIRNKFRNELGRYIRRDPEFYHYFMWRVEDE